MSIANNFERYAFATFELDTNVREVRRDGRVQTVQPRVFDLLVYLIRNRHRVVSKTELLDEVWAGAEVNENVIARAVMLAREAIGDKSERGRLVRTIHRVGYRFCVTEEIAPATGYKVASAESQADRSAATETAVVRIAVMPIENRTVGDGFGWVPLGLSSLIARALDADPRFSVVPMATTLETLAYLPHDASQAQKAERLVQLVGAQCVLCSTARGAPPCFEIEFKGEGPRGAGLAGRLDGNDLTELGEWLAREVERHAFPRTEAVLCFDSSSALVNQTFACSLQARTEQRYDAALKLIEVVLDLEPGNADAMLFQLQVMMNVLDPRVIEFGAIALRHPRFIATPRLSAQAHASLGLASMQLAECGETAKAHATRALQLVGSGRVDESALRIYGICGVIADWYGDPMQSRALAEYCIDKQRLSGDRYSLALNLVNLAGVDIEEDALQTGRARLEEGLTFFRANGHTNAMMVVLVNLAIGVEARSGEWALAAGHCDEARALLPAFAWQHNSILSIASMSIVYAELSMLDPIDAALREVRTRDGYDAPTLKAAWLTVNAHRSIAAGDFEAARGTLAEALALYRVSRSTKYVRRSSAILLRNEIRAGHADAALTLAEVLLAEEPCLRLDGEVQGLRLHAFAILAHSRDDDSAASVSLARAIECLPSGISSALAIMDAASLALESTRFDEAEVLLARIPNWTREHPHGRALATQLRNARDGLPVPDRAPCLLSMSIAVWGPSDDSLPDRQRAGPR